MAGKKKFRIGPYIVEGVDTQRDALLAIENAMAQNQDFNQHGVNSTEVNGLAASVTIDKAFSEDDLFITVADGDRSIKIPRYQFR